MTLLSAMCPVSCISCFNFPLLLAVRDFDEAATCHWFGFSSVDQYYAAASSGHQIHAVNVPLLCIGCAVNVPLLCIRCAVNIPLLCIRCAVNVRLLCIRCACVPAPPRFACNAHTHKHTHTCAHQHTHAHTHTHTHYKERQ